MHSSLAVSAIDPIISLPGLLREMTAKITDAELDACPDQLQHVLRLCFGLPPNNNWRNGAFHAASATPWRKRELAIGRIITGLCDGSLPALVFDRASGQLHLLEPADWRTAAFIDEIIRSGFIRACAGESIGRHHGHEVLIRDSNSRRWQKRGNFSPGPLRPNRRACRDWLTSQMLASPERAPKLQTDYMREAKARFNVSQRPFKALWKEALQATGARWRRGRPARSR
jgi:hypothetical protein